MDNEIEPRCPLSLPTHLPHTLSIRRNFDLRFGCYTCCGQKSRIEQGYSQYYCTTCGVEFHMGCHGRPRKIMHPYHLQHPLTISYRNLETGTVLIGNMITVGSGTPASDHGISAESLDVIWSRSEIIFDNCTWCKQDLKGGWFYHCSLCSFCLDLPCAETIPPLTIPNPKSHQHPLIFFPRSLSTQCDACGLVNALEPSYTCFQCDYLVHQNCIDLPRVIKITRHFHRLSHTPYLSQVISSCRICYKKVDNKYGQYSCNHDDCSYAAHSKCATHENIWDGRELEWKKEEPEDPEDLAPFKKLGDDLIKHFGHEHCLRLAKYDGTVRDAEQQCEACIFPINNSSHFYNCKKCDFFLHEVCANLPRKLDHALHNHRLVLDPSPRNDYKSMCCSFCFRPSTGFMYKCSDKDCEKRTNFQVDVRCILVPECFTHKSHPEHPLFISTTCSGSDEIICKGCKNRCWKSHLQCTTCEFAMCYQCATIPSEIVYKYDEHPLTLCYGETAGDMYWCEVCEEKVDPTEWFYICNKCCITIHRQCIFGSSVYMKPGCGFYYQNGSVKVSANRSNTRPFCSGCQRRCTDSVLYKSYSNVMFYRNNRYQSRKMVICSLYCLDKEAIRLNTAELS